MPLESCPESHGASKSSWDTETVEYSPRKRPEMADIMSFHDATRVVTRGSRGIEILLGPKNRGRPRKRLKMAEIMSFDDATRVMSRESRGIEILPVPKIRGL